MTTVVRFDFGLKPVIKHLTGQHDQKSHGSWAAGGLPHELTSYDNIDELRDAGLIAGGTLVGWKLKVPTTKIESTWTHGDLKPEGEGWVEGSYSGKWVREVATTVSDSLDKRFTAPNIDKIKEDLTENGKMTPELESRLAEIEKQYLGGDADKIEEHYFEIAMDMGLGERNAKYYSEAMTRRASIYVSSNNAMVAFEYVKLVAPLITDKDSREIYTNYVKNFEKTTATVADNLSNSSPVIAIESDDFLSVIADGRFKTQYETRESNGAYAPAMRKTRELAFLGVPMEIKAKERPIYGYLARQVAGETPNTSGYNSDKWNIDNTAVSQYGDVRVVLNDNVRGRTSYTIPDSLDADALARPLTENHTFESMSYAGLHVDQSMSHGGFQRQGYAEAQVYGGIKLSDIKQIYVTPTITYNSKGERVVTPDSVKADAIRGALQAKGLDIPVIALQDISDKED